MGLSYRLERLILYPGKRQAPRRSDQAPKDMNATPPQATPASAETTPLPTARALFNKPATHPRLGGYAKRTSNPSIPSFWAYLKHVEAHSVTPGTSPHAGENQLLGNLDAKRGSAPHSWKSHAQGKHHSQRPDQKSVHRSSPRTRGKPQHRLSVSDTGPFIPKRKGDTPTANI